MYTDHIWNETVRFYINLWIDLQCAYFPIIGIKLTYVEKMPNETACVPEYMKHLPFKYHEEFEIQVENILVSYSEVRWVLLAKPLKKK